MCWENKEFEIPKIEDYMKEIAENVTIQTVITEDVQKKIKQLTRMYPDLEWMAGLIGKKTENGYTITEIMIPEQIVTGGTVKATNKGARQLSETEGVVGWIHSHNTMSSFQSSTDEETANSHGLTMTVNNDLEYSGLAKTTIKINDKEKEVLVEIDPIFEEERAWDKELEEIAKKNITEEKEKVKTETKTIYEKNTVYEICDICERPVGKHNREECVQCGAVMHKRCRDKTKECPTCFDLNRIEKEEMEYNRGYYPYGHGVWC